jgi:RimJ/RimL family protein N-acetyltransferase
VGLVRVMSVDRQSFSIADITLAGSRVRLAPLTRAWVEKALAERAAGKTLPFVTLEAAAGRLIGSTRFFNIDPANLKAEIGFTWLVAGAQRTGVNREAKYLMLRHAFETWKLRRVEFKAHAQNQQSRAALLRLGAVEEGTLRKHMVMPDGSARDSVYFSIVDAEWPEVNARLEAQLSLT